MMGRLPVKGAFNGEAFFFELQNQREDRRRRAAVEERAAARACEPRDVRILRDEDQCDVCVSSLRLQLSQLMLGELESPQIAPHKFKDRR